MEKSERIELGNLCQDTIESIFPRIPLKSLIKSKSVSKTWLNFISQFRRQNPITTSRGLVIHLASSKTPLYKSTFFKLYEDIPEQLSCCCTFDKSFTRNYPYMIDSCNGLLLYASIENGFWYYHIWSPFNDEVLTLPCAHEQSRPACVALAFEFDKFKVICFFFEEADAVEGRMNCKVFSSQTWNWEEHETQILNSDLLLDGGFFPGQCSLPSVYSGGRLYWIWSIYLLIFDDDGNNEFFKVVKLPRNHISKGYLKKLLWKSDGKIHFCDPDDKGFCIWTYNDDDEKNTWKINQFVILEGLKLQRSSSSCVIRPCAFNEDLQALFLHVSPGIIVAYSFETRKFTKIWSFGEIEDNYCVLGSNEYYARILKIFSFQFDFVSVLALSKLASADN